ncbi:Filament-like plant protein 4 [Camellia lanceoleosa]|uniref:Filament-like plant protein 4 n=1 Tax=Camellia lanceoleosa TaxID=1840588 RepID=A0ACC0GTU0_9ERIC|nr:Filament-like plant protein 4 [Camellia lanceoleosa]
MKEVSFRPLNQMLHHGNAREEFEQLKLEKITWFWIWKAPRLISENSNREVKSQLASAQKLNSLAEAQLKCMAESYKSLGPRAEEFQTERLYPEPSQCRVMSWKMFTSMSLGTIIEFLHIQDDKKLASSSNLVQPADKTDNFNVEKEDKCKDLDQTEPTTL